MALPDEFFGEIRDDPLDAPVEVRHVHRAVLFGRFSSARSPLPSEESMMNRERPPTGDRLCQIGEHEIGATNLTSKCCGQMGG